FFSSRRRHTRFSRDWSSDVCSSDLLLFSIVPKFSTGFFGVNSKKCGTHFVSKNSQYHWVMRIFWISHFFRTMNSLFYLTDCIKHILCCLCFRKIKEN